MTTAPRIAVLAEALEQADAMLQRPVDGTTRKRHRKGAYYRRDCAALVVALLPPDWCGHVAAEQATEQWDRLTAEIARLRKIEEAARAVCDWSEVSGVMHLAALRDALRAALEADHATD